MGLVVDRAQLLGTVPGDFDFHMPFISGQGPLKSGVLARGGDELAAVAGAVERLTPEEIAKLP